MVKSTNPMEAYRREQKKKELKKHRMERKKDKEVKLSSMDPVELKEKLKNLERQVAANPTDGPTRKRKQELEDTLRVVVKRQKEMAEEERKKLADAPPPLPMSITKLTEANKEKFQNPERSIYYHPTLNPFGAPPPGKPQMYRNASSGPAGPPQGLARGYSRQERPQQQRFRDQLPRSKTEATPSPARMQQPRMMARRPGKRPPLPLGPPPPGTIQVPSRPPLPSGTIPARPPPPPPVHTRIAGAVVPPPPFLPQPRGIVVPSSSFYPATVVAANDREMESSQAEVDMDENDVVAPYPTTDEPEFHDSCTEEEQKMDEEAATRAAALCSLVPVALRVQRQVPAPPSASVARVSSAPSVPVSCRPPAPVPRPTMPSIDVLPGPPPRPTNLASNSSLSNEFNTFMEEVKDLLD
ncbi:unnamed protein product [Peronospora destructor]|uniref:Wbp11/ELF5/Saf1 N-terminal domain-containing protein n=1 Tax=Peronospora destructor TaxID=86335 RepID=A0AAV0VG46_9STRA|nr:unnamed protein product [Peronospora destructor]